MFVFCVCILGNPLGEGVTPRGGGRKMMVGISKGFLLLLDYLFTHFPGWVNYYFYFLQVV